MPDGPGPPEIEACHWTITFNPAWQLTVEKSYLIGPCLTQTVNGLPSPKQPCAWVVRMHHDDSYTLNPQEGFGGGNCIEPLVQCDSGDCP